MKNKKIADKNELLNLPKEDLIWMIEMLRISRDTLAADNIRLRNIIASKETVDYMKDVARRAVKNG